MAVARDKLDRKIGAEEKQDERAERDDRQEALHDRDGPDRRAEFLATIADRGNAEPQLQPAKRRRQPQRSQSRFSDQLSFSAVSMPSIGGGM